MPGGMGGMGGMGGGMGGMGGGNAGGAPDEDSDEDTDDEVRSLLLLERGRREIVGFDVADRRVLVDWRQMMHRTPHSIMPPARACLALGKTPEPQKSANREARESNLLFFSHPFSSSA